MTFSVFQKLHAQAAQQPAFAVKAIGSNRCINYETPTHTQQRNFIEDEFHVQTQTKKYLQYTSGQKTITIYILWKSNQTKADTELYQNPWVMVFLRCKVWAPLRDT